MNARGFIGLTLLLAATAAHAAFDIDQLMTELAQHKGGRAKFTEKRYIAVLDKPVVTSGEMTYSPPDRLEKHTLSPKPESMVLDKDRLSLERNRRKFTINLASRPEALAFVDSVRSTLSGNRQSLERNYTLLLKGQPQHWVLTLTPTEPAILALLQRIAVSGSGNQVHAIDYLLADGDRTELLIEPMDAP